MERQQSIDELIRRIETLELLKIKLEKKSSALIAVASLLGILAALSIFGGIWLYSVTKDLQVVSAKTAKLENALDEWEARGASAFADVEAAKAGIFKDMEKKTNDELSRLSSESENIKKSVIEYVDSVLVEKNKKLVEAGFQGVIARLQDGTIPIRVRGLSVANDKGKTVVALYPDKGGDGFIRLNDEGGKMRYVLKLANNRPQSSYYNVEGKPSLSLGIYSANNVSYLRLMDGSGAKVLVNIDSGKSGGQLKAFHTSGKPIVFLGGDRKTGNGLVNVMGINGEKTVSQYPR